MAKMSEMTCKEYATNYKNLLQENINFRQRKINYINKKLDEVNKLKEERFSLEKDNLRDQDYINKLNGYISILPTLEEVRNQKQKQE